MNASPRIPIRSGCRLARFAFDGHRDIAGRTLQKYPNIGLHTGRILSDGRIEVAGEVFEAPSSAGFFVRKKATNGWNFWRLDPDGRRPLREVKADYLRVVSPEEAEEKMPIQRKWIERMGTK